MAYEVRDTLLSLVHKSEVSSKTKEWFSKTFGSDEGMMVSVHSPNRHSLKPCIADKHASVSELFIYVWILC
jgi:hypothetical protein